MSAKIFLAEAFEDGGVTLLARIVGGNGSLVTQASVNALSLAVYEYGTEEEARENTNGSVVVGAGGSLAKADHVYDTLQTGAIWTKDEVGYNFRYDAAEACLPNGGKWYRFEFKFTPTSGAAFWVVWVVAAVSLATS